MGDILPPPRAAPSLVNIGSCVVDPAPGGPRLSRVGPSLVEIGPSLVRANFCRSRERDWLGVDSGRRRRTFVRLRAKFGRGGPNSAESWSILDHIWRKVAGPNFVKIGLDRVTFGQIRPIDQLCRELARIGSDVGPNPGPTGATSGPSEPKFVDAGPNVAKKRSKSG